MLDPGQPRSERARLSRALPIRLVKFCVVGASGVVVNLGALLVLADWLRIHANVAAALAIEISIVSNFVLNDIWTFRDQRAGRSWLGRLLRFHVVSAVGAAIQWSVFVTSNALLFAFFLCDRPATWSVAKVIVAPSDVGSYKILSQLAGIAVATCWNFLANKLWTWEVSRRGVTQARLLRSRRG